MWEAVWARHRAAGRQWTSITPEFGPDGYTHLLPFTRAPIADTWDLNRWMAADLRRQFDIWSRP